MSLTLFYLIDSSLIASFTKKERSFFRKISAVLRGRGQPHSLRNPYRYIRSSQKLQPYGETPLVTWKFLAQALPIKERQLLIDFGAGRMLGGLYLSIEKKIDYIGIERDPLFIQRAFLAKKAGWQGEPLFEDLLTVSPRAKRWLKSRKPRWIYFYGSGLQPEIIQAAQKLAAEIACDQTKVIAVDHDWGRELPQYWKTVKKIEMPFPTKKASLYVMESRFRL